LSKKEKNIPKKDPINLQVIEHNKSKNNFDSVVIKLCNISSFKYIDNKVENAFSFMVRSNEYFIPITDNFDKDAELARLNKDLNYTEGFLKIVESKLSNQKFVDNAPANLVKNEKNKLVDAKEKIRILKEKINSLN